MYVCFSLLVNPQGVRVIIVLACVALGTVGVVVLITMYHEEPNQQRTDKRKYHCVYDFLEGLLR